jgi:hypothetical protein
MGIDVADGHDIAVFGELSANPIAAIGNIHPLVPTNPTADHSDPRPGVGALKAERTRDGSRT